MAGETAGTGGRADLTAASRGITEQEAAEIATLPNPHPLFWVLTLFLLFACFGVAGVTWVYVKWAADEKKLKLTDNLWFLGFGHALRLLNTEVAPEGFRGDSYDPQRRFRSDPITNPLMPRVGAGVYLPLFNLLVLGLSYYFIMHVVMAMAPYVTAGHQARFVPIAVATNRRSGRDCFLRSGLSPVFY